MGSLKLKQDSADSKLRVFKGGGNAKSNVAIIVSVAAVALATVGFGAYNVVQTTKIASTSTASNEDLETLSTSLQKMYSDLNDVNGVVQSNRMVLGTVVKDGETGDGTDIVSQLDNISANISTNQADILSLIDYINNGGTITEEDYQNILAQYEVIEGNVTNINTDLTSIVSNIDSKIDELAATTNNNYDETINTLEDVQNSLTSVNQTLQQSMTQNFNTLNQLLADSKKEINTNISNLSNDTKTQYDSLTTQISTMSDTVSTTISENNIALTNSMEENNTLLSNTLTENNEAMKAYVKERCDNLDTSVAEVFQLVSNGKKNVVSTLLTKYQIMDTSWNVEREGSPTNVNSLYNSELGTYDVSWAEICKGIADLPLDIILTGDEPELVYYYHYHTCNKDGDYVETNTLSSGNTNAINKVSNDGYVYTYKNLTGSGSCYVAAGHVHSSTDAQLAVGGNHNNIKFSGHYCSSETYTYTSTCGRSCTGQGHSYEDGSEHTEATGGIATPGKEFWHGDCPVHGQQRSYGGPVTTCGHSETKTGYRFTCGNPTNIWLPSKCGRKEGELVYTEATFEYKGAPSTGTTEDEVK